ncbi:hypothetical protein MRB53_036883 [Persea americana]|nr:hypothetical protein MRB53_036883 [Persea americana]
MSRVKEIAEKVAKAWKITGPFNMQIIKAGEDLKVIECNLRASRSFPFSSKVLGTNFIDVATRALVGRDVPEPVDLMAVKRDFVATKVPQFSWTRLAGADPYLGVEMSSTGEMACFGKDLIEAYWASMQSTMNFRLPQPGEGLLFGGDTETPDLASIGKSLQPLGYKYYAANSEIKNHLEKGSPWRVGRADRVPETGQAETEGSVMRRNATDFGIALFMEPRTAVLFAQCMAEKIPQKKEGVIPSEVKRWSEWAGWADRPGSERPL